MAKLTDKQEAFCIEYMIDLNATRAAKRAGYSEKTAKDIGCQNLAKLNIQERIAELMQARNEKTQIDAEWVLNQAVKVHERCMQGEPIIDREGGFTGEWKFEHAGANKSLELIGKHVDVQAFKERVEHKHTVEDMTDESLEDKIAKLLGKGE